MRTKILFGLICCVLVAIQVEAEIKTCDKDDDCKGENVECMMFEGCDGKGQCMCKDEFTDTKDDAEHCVPDKKGNGKECTEDDECMTSFKCDGTCKCGDAKELYLGVCIDTGLAAFEGNCDADDKCKDVAAGQTTVECTGNPEKCKCKAGYVRLGDLCQKQEYQGECNDDPDVCDDSLKMECTGTADDEKCGCMDQFDWNASLKRCVPKGATEAKKGDPCEEDFSKYCEKNYMCGHCPDKPDDLKCIREGEAAGSATSLFVNMAAMLGLVCFAWLWQL